MGVEYYLINKENKTFYALGKGGWYCLKDDIEALTDLKYLELFIFEDVFSQDDEEDEEWMKYCKEIGAEIFEAAKCNNIKNLVIVNDCGDDTTILRALKYKCIGSRYRSKEDPGINKKQIEFENRHLDPKSPPHLYDLEKLLQPAKFYVAGVGYVSLPNSESPLQSLVDEYLKVE